LNIFPTQKEESQPSSSLFAATQAILRKELYHCIEVLQPTLRADMLIALQSPGKLLCQTERLLALPAGSWALLVFYSGLCVHTQVSQMASYKRLCRTGIAVECFICALDLLDDVEDGDQTPIIEAIGISRALNVATALLALAQQVLLSVDAYPSLKAQLSLALQNALLQATEGQHRDLVAESQPASDFTQQDCIDIAAQKAGSLMSLACSIGVLCVEAPEEVYQKFAQIGHLVGIAAQLDNDSHDLYYLIHTGNKKDHAQSYPTTVKTDLIRGKKTLPLVLAHQQRTDLSEVLSPADVATRQQLFSEAIYTSWGVSLLYQERALECLRQIEKEYAISPELRALLRMSN